MFGVEQPFTRLAESKQPLVFFIYFFADAAQTLTLTLHAARSPRVSCDILKEPHVHQKKGVRQQNKGHIHTQVTVSVCACVRA